MPRASDEPLRKVTLNLYEADCAYLEKAYGHGWSQRAREIINDFCKEKRRIIAQRDKEIRNV